MDCRELCNKFLVDCEPYGEQSEKVRNAQEAVLFAAAVCEEHSSEELLQAVAALSSLLHRWRSERRSLRRFSRSKKQWTESWQELTERVTLEADALVTSHREAPSDVKSLAKDEPFATSVLKGKALAASSRVEDEALAASSRVEDEALVVSPVKDEALVASPVKDEALVASPVKDEALSSGGNEEECDAPEMDTENEAVVRKEAYFVYCETGSHDAAANWFEAVSRLKGL